MGGAMTKKAKDQVSLCRETGGTELNLSDCDIRKLGSFKSIVRLKLLVRLNLSHNYLQGMPPTVKKLVNLEELDISYNGIAQLPWEIYQLSNLHVLITEGNGITALPSPSISRLVKLETLSLACNAIKGLPEDFTGLTSLTSLSLSKNSLSRVFPEVFQLRQLRQLYLAGNQGIEMPDRLGELTQLQILDMSDCGLKALSPTIGDVPTLTSLRLEKNQLTSLPDELSKLSLLKVLNVGFNALTVFDNVTFRNFVNLEELHVSNNQIDHLPRGLGQCKKLRVIDLSYNLLKTINRELGWLHATVRKLNLGNNKIRAVPGELMFLNPAVDLDLNNNPLGVPFAQWYGQGVITLMENLKPYLRAYPAHCMAEGDALNGTSAGTPTSFIIQASDYHGSGRLNGGDDFEVVFKGVDPKDNNPIEQKGVVKDNQDGTYTVFFNAMIAGKFELHISESGEPIANFPMPYTIAPGPVDVTESVIEGIPPSSVPVGSPVQLSITTRDRFRNAAPPDQSLYVTVSTPEGQAKLSCQPTSPNVFICAFKPASPGDHHLSIQYKGVHLLESPYLIYVL